MASAQTYKSIGEYKLPGTAARGVAVDSDARRLYAAVDGGVAVLNVDTGANLGMVAGLSKATDVLLIPEMKGDDRVPSTKAFASDASGHVISFSLQDLKTLTSAKLPTAGASSLCYDIEAKTVEAVSAGGSLMTMDADTGKTVREHRLQTGDGQIVCGNMNHVYVADTKANVVHVLNHEKMISEGDFPMMTGHGPSGLALDTKGRRLFVSCEDGTIEIVDTDSGFTFIELQSGSGPARETFAWTPQGKGQWKAAAFIAQADGTLTGIKMNAFINYSLGGAYKLAPGLGAIAYDEKTHHLFIASTTSGAPVVVVAGY